MTGNDINTTQDIKLLVDSFYDKVRKDNIIGNIFNTIIGDDWSVHLPIMYRFWESVLLHMPGYSGNPVKKHIELDKKIPLEKAHYNQWLALWNETIDSLFSGTVAEEAKKRAGLMMDLIDMKISWARTGKAIQ